MRPVLRWSDKAIDDLGKLGPQQTDRITRKVEWFAKQAQPLAFAKSLGGNLEDVYRFRVGDYRVLFEILNGKVTVLMVLRVKHRREVYR